MLSILERIKQAVAARLAAAKALIESYNTPTNDASETTDAAKDSA